MKNRWTALALGTVFLLATVISSSQSPDPASRLAAARQALGGAALDSIGSFTVKGSLFLEAGPRRTERSVEINWVSPDKFVRRQTYLVPGGAFGRQVEATTLDGFNGDEPIRSSLAPGSSVPLVIPAGPPPSTPSEIAAARQKQADNAKLLASKLLIPLFAAGLSTYPAKFASAGAVQLPTGTADALDVQTPSGFTWRLLLDQKTQLPVAVSWMSPPAVMMSVQSTVRAGPDGRATPVPGTRQVDAPAGLPSTLVEWRTTISDYRLADGVNWPHRFTTTMDGARNEELRLDKFQLNSKIDPARFTPTK